MLDWNKYWDNLIRENKLVAEIESLNIQDEFNGFEAEHTKNICKDIYEDFENKNKDFDDVKTKFLTIIEGLKNVHSFSSRLKAADSLILKVIRKRVSSYREDKYKNIGVGTYCDTLGDIIGMRVILHYQGQWQDVHRDLISVFPEQSSYPDEGFVAHRHGEQFIAEEPKAYYADGDDLSQFEGIIRAVPHENGYRSKHYIISFKNVYIELQVRTIYDEAWSDCDHSYVYKNEANPNNLALTKLTKILAKTTNTASDISEMMRSIYFGEYVSCQKGKIAIDPVGRDNLKKIIDDLSKAQDALNKFYTELETA